MLRSDLKRLHVISQDVRKLGNGPSSEAAISAETEIGQILACRGDPLLEPRHVVNGAEIDARALRVQVLQRRQEGIVAAIEHRKVDPVHSPAGCRHNGVGELHREPEIVWLEARPPAKRAKAEVIAERDLGRDVRREVTHLPQIAFDRAFERKAGILP